MSLNFSLYFLDLLERTTPQLLRKSSWSLGRVHILCHMSVVDVHSDVSLLSWLFLSVLNGMSAWEVNILRICMSENNCILYRVGLVWWVKDSHLDITSTQKFAVIANFFFQILVYSYVHSHSKSWRILSNLFFLFWSFMDLFEKEISTALAFASFLIHWTVHCELFQFGEFGLQFWNFFLVLFLWQFSLLKFELFAGSSRRGSVVNESD